MPRAAVTQAVSGWWAFVAEAGASITECVPWKGLLMCVVGLPCMRAVEEGSTVCVSSGGAGRWAIAFLAARRPAAWVPS